MKDRVILIPLQLRDAVGARTFVGEGKRRNFPTEFLNKCFPKREKTLTANVLKKLLLILMIFYAG